MKWPRRRDPNGDYIAGNAYVIGNQTPAGAVPPSTTTAPPAGTAPETPDSTTHDHHQPSADQHVRAVQGWMALDLHTALGHKADPSTEHQGHRSWGDWWAVLLGEVRGLVAEAATNVMQPDLDHPPVFTGPAVPHDAPPAPEHPPAGVTVTAECRSWTTCPAHGKTRTVRLPEIAPGIYQNGPLTCTHCHMEMYRIHPEETT